MSSVCREAASVCSVVETVEKGASPRITQIRASPDTDLRGSALVCNGIRTIFKTDCHLRVARACHTM